MEEVTPHPVKDGQTVDEQVWRRIVETLHGDVDRLADAFSHELLGHGYYDHGRVTPQQILDSARSTFTALIELLALEGVAEGPSLGDAPAAQAAAEDLGRSRAHQGVPLSSLVQAIRLDFGVLWRRIKELALPTHVDVLVARTEHIHYAVEAYSAAVQLAFTTERARIQHDARVVTDRVVARLFDEAELDADAVSRICTGLGVEADTRFEAALLPVENGTELDRRMEPAFQRGTAWRHQRADTIAFVRPLTGGRRLADDLAGLGALLLPICLGVAELRRTVRGSARTLANLPSLSRPTEFLHVWEHEARRHLSDATPWFLREWRELIESIPLQDRALVVEAAQAYMETGSIRDTAGALYCHRNTVQNRFRMLKERVGLDVTVPREAALLQILFSADTTELDAEDGPGVRTPRR